MDEKIKIIVTDDQNLFRESLSLLLKCNKDIEIIAEASNGKELIDKLKVVNVDIVLLDVVMPVMDGMTALEIITKRFPSTKVIILSGSFEINLVSEFMSKGASCYLSKWCGKAELIEAIKCVHAEGFYFDKLLSNTMRQALLKRSSPNSAYLETTFKDKEMQILKKVCKGKTNKEIASVLNITASTVDFYKGKIYSKTECHNIAELIKYALVNDLISISEL